MRIWGEILHPVKMALNLVLKMTSIPSTVTESKAATPAPLCRVL